jgi:uncharacterized membrane protein
MPQTDPDRPPSPLRLPAAALAALLSAGLVALARRFPLDGHEHGNLGQFLGRFHPALVHLPVALLLLVPLMEVAGLFGRRADLRAAAGWVLVLAAASAFVAAYDGWLLAWSGGYRGRDVTLHLGAALWLPPVVSAAALLRAYAGRCARIAYALVLLMAVATLVKTADLGGAVTHGDRFLTERMPVRLRTWLGITGEAPASPASPQPAAPVTPKGGPGSADPANAAYYSLHIAPLLGRSCVSCHRAEKHKGGLRMDSLALLLRGGEDGPALVPGDVAKSDLVRRVHLQPTDDDFMPSDNEKPLTPEEIQMIEHWIAAGAKGG